MKKIQTFEEFINESQLNEGKYDNTFYQNIVDAKFKDGNWKKYKEGKTLNFKGPSPTKPEEMARYAERYNFDKNDTVPFQRMELQDNISPNNDWSKVPDKEIIKTMNDMKNYIVDEVQNRVIMEKITNELERIFKNGELRVYSHATVPEHLKIKFVRPIFSDQTDKKAALAFLIRSNSIEVNSQPTVVNKWQVEYSGTVENDKGEVIKFEKINNGLAVQVN
jgi:hypothetical protein